jgi:hypothetical protein
VEIEQIEGPENGSFLEIGTYFVLYEAIYDACNTTTCSFEIEVVDTTARRHLLLCNGCPFEALQWLSGHQTIADFHSI